MMGNPVPSYFRFHQKVVFQIVSNIYIITNKINNKKYVGQSVDVLTRWNQHKFSSRQKNTNIILYNAMAKYGIDNFSIETIENEIPISEIDGMEKYWIEKLNTLKPNGYNMTLGGEGSWGREVSESTKKKISKSQKERYENMSEEEKQELINRLPKDGYDLDKMNEGFRNWIKNCPIEKRKEVAFRAVKTKREKGYDFYNYSFGKLSKTEKDEMYKKISINNPKSQCILMLDKDYNIVQEFHSIREASRYLHKNFGYSLNSRNNIASALDTDKIAYKYKWKRK